MTSMKGVPTFMLGETTEDIPTGSTLHKKEGPDFQLPLPPWDIVDVVFRLQEVLLLESISTEDLLDKSPQQQHLWDPFLLQDRQLMPVVPEA